MKVLLVSFFNDEAYGVRVIHSNLIKNNIDSYMLFFKLPNGTDKISSKKEFIGNCINVSDVEIDILASHIKNNKYNVVGFSLVSQNFNLYKKIYNKIKEIKDLIVVIGGWQVSLNPDKCIDYADFLCIGEGEIPMTELIVELGKKKLAQNIKNIWTKNNNMVFKNQVRNLEKNISSFPSPVFENKYSYVIENNEIKNEEPYFFNSRYGTFINRGCPYKCTYCSNSYMADNIYPHQWSRIRQRDTDHVKKELILMKEKLIYVKSVNFYDEVFNPSVEWIKDFFSWYKKEINIPFYVFFYPGICSEEKARVLSENGLKGVWLGIQSGSKRVREKVFKRFYTNECVINQANIFHKFGVNVKYDFILDNPFETFEESLESIHLMLQLPQPFSLNLFSLKYFPNTEITKMAKDCGFISNLNVDDNNEKDQDTYAIHQDRGGNDDEFINHLAFYISNLSNGQITERKKNEIFELINCYRVSKNLQPIRDLVKVCFST